METSQKSLIQPLKIEHCKYCNEEIAWLKRHNGRKIAVNVHEEKRPDNNSHIYDPKWHESHIKTCQFRDKIIADIKARNKNNG